MAAPARPVVAGAIDSRRSGSAGRIHGARTRCTAAATGDRATTGRSGPAETGCGVTGVARPSAEPLGPAGSTRWPSGRRKLGFCAVASECVNESNGATGLVAVTVRAIGARSCQAARWTTAGVEPVPDGVAVSARSCCRGAGSEPPRLHHRATRHLPRSIRRVDAPDLAGEPLPFVVLQIQQIVHRPVEMEGDVRDLLIDPVGRVRRYSPRRPPATSMANSCSQLGQVTAALVWPS